MKRQIKDAMTEAYVDWHLIAEQSIKSELFPGHGYDTGTLNRSVHAEGDDYNWAGDNVPRTRSSPERGGKRFKPTVTKDKISGGIGSGMVYALAVHQGSKHRVGLRYIIIGVLEVQDRWSEVIHARALQHADRRRL